MSPARISGAEHPDIPLRHPPYDKLVADGIPTDPESCQAVCMTEHGRATSFLIQKKGNSNEAMPAFLAGRTSGFRKDRLARWLPSPRSEGGKRYCSCLTHGSKGFPWQGFQRQATMSLPPRRHRWHFPRFLPGRVLTERRTRRRKGEKPRHGRKLPA